MTGLLLTAAVATAVCPGTEQVAGFTIEGGTVSNGAVVATGHRVGDLPVDVVITAVDAEGKRVEDFCGSAEIAGLEVRDRGQWTPAGARSFRGGRLALDQARVAGPIVVTSEQVTAEPVLELREIPGFLSIIPPLFAILLAIVLREALLALFAGVWIGALFVHGYDPITALFRTFDTYIVRAVVPADGSTGHAAIVVFTMALGGMVGIIARSGGSRALVEAISRRARTRRSGMLTAWASGLVVFFDDYANCLLVGNTVRPFTDELKISREKLAYLVDSTAAPIATVAIISTWIGFQISEIENALAHEGVDNGYDVFLSMLPYSFYSLFTLAFVFFLAWTVRDFGPMLRAERRAAAGDGLVRPGSQPLMDRELTEMDGPTDGSAHWMTAVIPIASVIAIVFVGLYVSGRQALGDDASAATVREIIAKSDSYAVLLWAAFGGSLIAFVTAVARKTTTLTGALDAWIGGVKAMVIAVLILVLAWALGDMCKDQLQTGAWLISQVSPSPQLLPVITFVVSGLIALATGSSFSTMAIVIPIAGPMAWALTGDGAVAADLVDPIRFSTLAAVLSGAVFGDHCSPISDTSIMSSMSAASDHIDHIRTQAPYALVCAGIAAGAGFLPAGYGAPPWLSLAVGGAVAFAVVRFLGRPVTDA